MSELTLAVLCGGGSRRMGTDKALLDAGGMPLAARPGAILGALVAEVLLAGRALPGVAGRVVEDAPEGEGPLAGVVAALRAARTELVVVVPCDAPELEPGLVALLAGLLAPRPTLQVAVARSACGLEPLPAVLRAAAAERLAGLLASGVGALHEAWRALPLVIAPAAVWSALDPEGRSFRSWNQPGDARRLAVATAEDGPGAAAERHPGGATTTASPPDRPH